MGKMIPIELLNTFPVIYAVGGCVRDRLLGKEPHDLDFAVPYHPKETMKMAMAAGYHSVPTGIDNGTVTVIVDDKHYEITTFRKDVECDGRQAKSTFSDTIEEDLSRRDFTINAMAMDKSGILIDPYGGHYDLKSNIIKTVGDPFDRFEEDYLRIIRAARFGARFGAEYTAEIWDAMCYLAPKVMEKVSPERIFMEFNKAFSEQYSGEQAALFVHLLYQCGLLQLIFPEFKGTDKLKQNPMWHPEGSVWTHTMEVLSRAKPTVPHRWAAFLHDCGKAGTATLKENTDYYTFYGHAEFGAGLVDTLIAPRLKFPNDLKEFVYNMVKFHLLPMDLFVGNKKSNDYPLATLRKFQAKINIYLHELPFLVQADQGEARYLAESAALFQPVAGEIKPVLLGRHLLNEGVLPGLEMGQLLAKAFEIQLEEGVCNVDELLNRVIGEKII
jgi:tRNA nucleotidyltransferase/poly(A) polymerase